jgi:hypothetical protein
MTESLNRLSQMGFTVGDVVETIVTTLSSSEVPNAAPMGVWVDSGDKLTLHPFEGSSTAENIKQTGVAVVNITNNPQIFLATAFKEELPGLKIPPYEPAKEINAPRLEGMLAYVEVQTNIKHTDEPSARFHEYSCGVKHLEIAVPFPVVHSRTRCAAIECIIHATRIRALHSVDDRITQNLLSKINELHDVIQRIAPESPSATVIQQVVDLLPRWIR